MKSTENIFHVVIFIILRKVALAFEWGNPEGRLRMLQFKWKPLMAMWLSCGSFCYLISFPLGVWTKSFVHLIPCLSINFSNWIILWQLDVWSYNLQTKVIMKLPLVLIQFIQSFVLFFVFLSLSIFISSLSPSFLFLFEACLVSTYSCHMKKIMI